MDGVIAATRWQKRSFWDVEDCSESIAVRDTTISRVSTDDVAEFSARYHYTGTGGAANWRWGLWHEQVLLGIVAYNLPTRSACESVFGPDHQEHVWHMGRLVLADRAPHNSESRLIGGSLRSIRREHPEVWAVLTYAATDVGHIGYVYQATNALYTGLSSAEPYHVDEAGVRRSTYLDGRRVTAERAAQLGWAKVSAPPKHRYLYLTGTTARRRQHMRLLRLPVLPYPKDHP